jgi:putative Holliday junction resolvase
MVVFLLFFLSPLTYREGFFVVESLADAVLPCVVRVLCLDVGGKRIGVALSDPKLIIALALKVYTRVGPKRDVQEIVSLVRENDVSRIVVGLPKNLDGTIGEKAREIMEFAERLERAAGIPVVLWDERFSTNEAHRILDMGSVKQKKRKPFIDMMAAQVILQGYLDAQTQG